MDHVNVKIRWRYGVRKCREVRIFMSGNKRSAGHDNNHKEIQNRMNSVNNSSSLPHTRSLNPNSFQSENKLTLYKVMTRPIALCTSEIRVMTKIDEQKYGKI